MAFTPISPVEPLDLSGTQYVSGQTTEFPIRAEQRFDRIQAYANRLYAAMDSINALGTELQAAIEALETAAGANISTLALEITALEAALTAAEANAASVIDVANQLVSAKADAVLNEFPLHGRMLDFGGALTDSNDWANTGNNAAANFRGDILTARGFAGYNGSSVTLTETDRCIYNSSTFGGTEAAVSTFVEGVVSDMFSIQGTVSGTSAAFSEFAIGRFTAGTGTLSTSHSPGDGHTYYRALATSALSRRISQSGKGHISLWCRPVVSPVFMYGTDSIRSLFVNGASQPSGDYIELSPDTTYHVCHTWNFSSQRPGWANTSWQWLMRPSAEMDIWLPEAGPGNHQVLPHYSARRSLEPLLMQ